MPPDLAAAIEAESDMGTLVQGFDAAIAAATVDDFRAATRSGH